MTRLAEKYRKDVRPRLLKESGYKNVWQVPKVTTIYVGVGTGRIEDKKERKAIEESLALITGQKPSVRRSRKSIASFKLREGQEVGYLVTLRGARMEEFLDKFINITLPRVRDFRGISPESFDGHGNYSVGLKEQNVFPEVPFDEVDLSHGVQITIKTTAHTDKEAKKLLSALGMPFAKSAAELSSEDMTEASDHASLLAHAKEKAAKTSTKE